MKSRFVFFIAMMACFFRTSAQVNLVPNPSFEIYSTCPSTAGQMNLASGWAYGSLGGSPDYFNSCSNPSTVGVPSNKFGHQSANSGNAYAGFGNYSSLDYREYIEAKLDSTLISSHKYCVEFYVSLADTMLIACNNIGMYFSDTFSLQSTGTNLFYTPQISNDIVLNQLTNKIGWTKVSGDFIATGGENYIVIGNFLDNNNSDTALSVGGYVYSAYYYIDDVSVVDCTYDGIDEITGDKMHFKLYPNPNNGNMVLEYKIGDNETGAIEIYDLTGKMIKSNTFSSTNSSLSIDATNLEAGMYYYEINVDGNKMKTDKLIIIK